LAGAKFYPLHDRQSPANATLNPYKASDGSWFMLVVAPDKLQALATGIGRPDLLTDPRFGDAAKLTTNAPQLRAILDDVFASQPMQHWREVFDKAHITYGAILDPVDVVNDPQLRANNIVVPIEGAGGALTLTISSPMQVHGVAKEAAHRAPGLGEHNDEILHELGFDAAQIEKLHAGGTVPKAKERAA
jgi:formyl-CoA transferase